MIAAALLSSVLTASGPVELFHERDLFGTVRALADQRRRAGDHAPLVTDLVRLAQCEALPAVPKEDQAKAARLLVRLEASRGARLGEKAKDSDTVWRDLLDPAFFRRVPKVQAGALVWPVEEERWPDEALNFTLTPGCVRPPAVPGAELELLAPAIEAARTAPHLERSLANAIYLMAVLQLRQGQTEAAQTTAGRLDPSLLDGPEAAYAQLMRLELGLDPTDGYLELVGLPELEPVRLHLWARAAGVLIEQRRYPEAVAVTAPGLEEALSPQAPRTIAQDLLCRHVTALVGTGQLNGAAVLLPKTLKSGAPEDSASMLCLRELAMEVSSLRKLDKLTEQLIALAGPPQRDGDRWVEVASRALARRELAVAHALATRAVGFGPGRARLGGDTLLAEIAWARGDMEDFTTRLSALFAKPQRESGRLRSDREKLALVAGQALVNRMEEQPLPQLRTHLVEALRGFRRDALKRNQAAAEALLAAAEKRARSAARGGVVVPVVAVGDIQVSFRPPQMPPSAAAIDYPEPFSVLAVPAPDGSYVPWISATAEAVEVSDAT